MAMTEEDVLHVFERAAGIMLPNSHVELLLADSSKAHLRMVTRIPKPDSYSPKQVENPIDPVIPDPQKDAYCPVGTPKDCIAVRLRPISYLYDSQAIDACPQLLFKKDSAKRVLCNPISVAGQIVGVIYIEMESTEQAGEQIAFSSNTLATHLGNRLGLIRAMESAQRAAMVDSLTGLFNRRSLEDHAAAWLQEGKSFSLVLTDIDHFKKLNDSFNHSVGDHALKSFARALQNSCRANDVIARIGGEEFVILLANLGAEGAVGTMERFRKVLPDFLTKTGSPPLTASFGIVDSNCGYTLTDMIKMVDEALYKAKDAGRDRIVVANPAVCGTVKQV
ncbi:MAG TPA: GGDEF domain-containing protein [Dissulfurispiraceae bacterium]|nr:GGDEF domain-containing protein [Dissulfurispiraceae bacterium]